MVCEFISLCKAHVTCMQFGCVWFYVEGDGMTYSDGIIQVPNEKECQKTTGRVIREDG